MTKSLVSRTAIILFAVAMTAGCANTIRGVGADTAEAVDATQQAGRNIERSAR